MMNRLHRSTSRSRQRGVVLIFSLIVMLIMTIGAVALMRSMHTSMSTTGNLAFRRDLVNQGEQAVSQVVSQFKAGNIPASGITTTSDPTSNYSATVLPANNQGVPALLLVQDATFHATDSGADLAGATPDVTMRYVVDRLCTAGTVTPSTALCVQSSGLPTGGTANRNTAVAPPSATVYRLSVRVSGPRSTQAFLQTTFTKPD